MGDWESLRWGKAYDTVDAKGVPQLQLMERKMRKDKPELREGVGLWSFIDTLAVDLMMLSRAESTWKQYAAWYALFEEWGSIMGVDVEAASVSLEMLSKVLIRSLVWLGGGLRGLHDGDLHDSSGYTREGQRVGRTAGECGYREANGRDQTEAAVRGDEEAAGGGASCASADGDGTSRA